VHELLYKCGGIVFADVCGGIQTCNCVRIQAPTAATAPTVDAGDNAALQEQCNTLEEKLKDAELSFKKQGEVLQTTQRDHGKLQTKHDDLKAAHQELKEAHEGLKAAPVVCGV
jgi:chromosome segregation ATPase